MGRGGGAETAQAVAFRAAKCVRSAKQVLVLCTFNTNCRSAPFSSLYTLSSTTCFRISCVNMPKGVVIAASVAGPAYGGRVSQVYYTERAFVQGSTKGKQRANNAPKRIRNAGSVVDESGESAGQRGKGRVGGTEAVHEAQSRSQLQPRSQSPGEMTYLGPLDDLPLPSLAPLFFSPENNTGTATRTTFYPRSPIPISISSDWMVERSDFIVLAGAVGEEAEEQERKLDRIEFMFGIKSPMKSDFMDLPMTTTTTTAKALTMVNKGKGKEVRKSWSQQNVIVENVEAGIKPMASDCVDGKRLQGPRDQYQFTRKTILQTPSSHTIATSIISPIPLSLPPSALLSTDPTGLTGPTGPIDSVNTSHSFETRLGSSTMLPNTQQTTRTPNTAWASLERRRTRDSILDLVPEDRSMNFDLDVEQVRHHSQANINVVTRELDEYVHRADSDSDAGSSISELEEELEVRGYFVGALISHRLTFLL